LKLKTSSLETPLLLPINFDVVHDGVAGDGEAEEALGGVGDAGGAVAADALAVEADAEGVAFRLHQQVMPLAGFEGVGDRFLFAFEGLFLFVGQRGFCLAGFADISALVAGFEVIEQQVLGAEANHGIGIETLCCFAQITEPVSNGIPA
jgi:hypothetical protein